MDLALTEYEQAAMVLTACFTMCYIFGDLPPSSEVGYLHFHFKQEEAKA